MFDKITELYQKVIDNNPDAQIELFKFSKLDIPFSRQWKRIAVNLSGGADSACLTYLLCKIIQDNNIDCKVDIITHIRCWNTRPWQEPIGINVYNRLRYMFPDIIDERHTNFIEPKIEHGVTGFAFNDGGKMRSGDQLQVDGYNSYCLYRFQLDAIFNATSHNPYGTDFDNALKARDIDIENATIMDLVLERADGHIFIPFKFVDKSWIIAQYYVHGIADLLNITRSCEGDVKDQAIKKTIPSYKAYTGEQDVPECGHCFWCRERNWAFTKLDETLASLRNE